MIQQLAYCLIIYFSVFYCSQLIRKYIRNFRGASFVRMVLFFVPYILPLFVFNVVDSITAVTEKGTVLIGLLLAIVPSIIALIVQFKSFKVFLSKDIYYLINPISLEQFLLIEASLLGSVIAEELFYRNLIPDVLNLWKESYVAIIASLLFTLSHFLQKDTRETCTLSTYFILFLLGLSWISSILYTGNIIFPMLGHLIYNLPNIIIAVFKFYLPSRLK
ncbi:CPBP family intramembrane glutamic endopeptidase [Paenibacillus macerans]|nr:CAAX protease self-immunity family protein [Paenibacillus macerans]SUA85487.1 CAAX amino terminal protease self- immunity [Paenibacillus macerans]